MAVPWITPWIAVNSWISLVQLCDSYERLVPVRSLHSVSLEAASLALRVNDVFCPNEANHFNSKISNSTADSRIAVLLARVSKKI